MARKSEFDPALLGDAELVVTSDSSAAAFSYVPGNAPVTLALARGKAAQDLAWCAQELNLPVVEASLDQESFRQLKTGEEIPESLYRPLARCLALVQRSRPAPTELKLVKSIGKAPDSLRRRLKKRAGELLDQLEVAQVSLKVGRGLAGPELTDTLAEHRVRLQLELGLPLPEIAWSEDQGLEPRGYEIQVRGVPALKGELGEEAPRLELGRVLLNVVESQAWRLVGYRETEALLEMVSRTHRRLYRDLFPGRLSLAAVRQVLRNLLRERLSIRDLPGILESLLDSLELTEDPDELTEYVRASMREYLSTRFSDRSGALHALVLDPAAERVIVRSLKEASSRLWLDLDLDESLTILSSVARGLQKLAEQKVPGVILCSPRPRRFLRRLLEPSFPYLPVLSYSEVAPLTEVNTVCMVGR